jgi:hypothetical protein
VSYRDDLDAARSRVKVLEVDLAEARERVRALEREEPVELDRQGIAREQPEERGPARPIVIMLAVLITLLLTLIRCEMQNARASAKPTPTPNRAALTTVPTTDGFDVSAFLAEAARRADAFHHDVYLSSLQAVHVAADGRSDRVRGDVTYMFCARGPEQDCPVEIDVRGTTVAETTSPGCFEAANKMCHHLDPPRCTLRQVWDRARRVGVPADALATISLAGKQWHFVVEGGGGEVWINDTGCE